MGQDKKGRLTGAHLRAARALVQWSALELSQVSSVSLRTIRRAEVAEQGTSLTVANELAIRRALEEAGVEFTNGDEPGVRLVGPAQVRVIAEGKSKVAKKTKPSKAQGPRRG